MIRPMSFLFLFCFALGCGPGSTRPETKRISWVQLVNDYRDFPDTASKAYRDRSVQIHIAKGTYRTGPGLVETYFGLPNTPGAIVFECEPPKDDKDNLLVTGTCRGIVRDGIERANGILWFVRVSDCSVTVLR